MTILLFAALFGFSAAATGVDQMCEGRGQSEFFTKQGTCREVYHCYKGQLSVRECPDNLWWNSEKGFCTYQANSGCTEEQVTEAPETPTTIQPLLLCEEDNIQFYSHESDCDRYYFCPALNAEPQVQSCTKGYHFELLLRQCIPEELSSCGVVPRVCPENMPKDTVIYVSHPTNCKLYYLCYNEQESEFSCQNDLVWNAAVNSCDHKDKVSTCQA